MDPETEAAENPKPPSPDKGRRRIAILAVLGIFALISLGQRQVSAMVDQRLRAKLTERGWTLTHRGLTWGPLQGIEVRELKLGKTGMAPALELSSLEVDIPLRALLGASAGSFGANSHRSAAVFRDEQGEIKWDNVSLKVEMKEGELEIRNLSGRHQGLYAELKGTVLIPEKAADGPMNWEPDFGGMRGVLASLRMEGAQKPFKVTGTFQVDARAPGLVWTTNLSGKGKALTWHFLPLEEVTAEASLGNAGSTVTARLALPEGEAEFTLTREDWQGSTPFQFRGTLTDAAERRDDFDGLYDPAEKKWLVKNVKGPADLLALAREIPELSAEIPGGVSAEEFPAIHLRNASLVRGEGWLVQTILLTSPGKLGVMMDGRKVEVSDLRGSLSRDKKGWSINRASAAMFDGQLSLRGTYHDSTLRNATISAEDMDLAEIKEASGRKGTSNGKVSFTYTGNVDVDTKSLHGRASLRLDNAPVIEVPLLDQTYDLFTSMIPGVERSKTGRFDATLIARGDVIDVPEFIATGGHLTVSAKGRIDLAKERIDGAARGKLTGLPGLVTKPLSRLLEMEVGGPFDDIRVKPLGPAKLASNTVSAIVGAPVETIEEAGKVTGAVIAEGIKVPFRFLKEKAAGKDE